MQPRIGAFRNGGFADVDAARMLVFVDGVVERVTAAVVGTAMVPLPLHPPLAQRAADQSCQHVLATLIRGSPGRPLLGLIVAWALDRAGERTGQ